MKKITLLVAALAILSLSSCKKTYECTCEGTSSTVYEALDNNVDDDDLDAYNDQAEDYDKSYTATSISTTDKTTKAGINAGCPAKDVTESYFEMSYYYYNPNTFQYEIIDNAIGVTSTITTECTAEKK